MASRSSGRRQRDGRCRGPLIGVPGAPFVLGILLLLLSFHHQFFIADHMTDDLLDLSLRLFLELCHRGFHPVEVAEMGISPPSRRSGISSLEIRTGMDLAAGTLLPSAKYYRGMSSFSSG